MAEAPIRHVLMTADGVGGVWDHALTLAAALARRGVRTTIAVPGGPLADDQRSAAAAVPGLRLEVGDWKLEWMPDAAGDVVASGQWLLDLALRTGPDIVHVNGYAHAALAFGRPVVCAAHSCVASWYAAVEGTEPPADFDAYRTGVVAGLQAADAVVAPSRAMLAALAWHHGVPVQGRVVPNGIDATLFAPAAKEPLILSVGRVWDRAKNIGALADVAPGLGAPVVVAGPTRIAEGPDFRPEGVRLLGRLPRDTLADWYARAAIFCLPARYEPFGLAILEAAQSGCALVLGDIPSLRENWEGAALFVRPDDHDGLRRTLNRLISDPGRCCDLATRARIRAGRFSAGAMADAWLALYSEVTVERRAPASALPAADPRFAA